MSGGQFLGLALLGAVVLFVIVTLFKAVQIVPQQQEYIVERLGKYRKTLTPGMNFLVPFLDVTRAKVDKREQVVSFPPQPVITSDNLVVSIDTVIYYVVTHSTAATYAIEDYLQGVEQLTVTTLRNVVGSMDLEQALTSRDTINSRLRAVLDEATGQWGIKVTRVEIKAIDPPPSVRESMEKQMRAERDKRAAILTAEGTKASQVLTAEGEQEAAILRAKGDRQSRILQAEGQSKAIETVFNAIHRSNPDEKLLAYQYLQTLPQIAAGESNKVWMVPAELTNALQAFSGAMAGMSGPAPASTAPAPVKPAAEPSEASSETETADEAPDESIDAAGENEPETPSASQPASSGTVQESTKAIGTAAPVPPSTFTGKDAADAVLQQQQQQSPQQGDQTPPPAI
ncbi:MAG TPA: SPFH/Band 7/PHB domain protein [Candidatus Stackebrandtia faecavium]|nr:SPFH/Band 7/PHB domain protein [Candidatus Stackebrandtia faecavium]